MKAGSLGITLLAMTIGATPNREYFDEYVRLLEQAQVATIGEENGWPLLERAAELQDKLDRDVYREQESVSGKPIGFWTNLIYDSDDHTTDDRVRGVVLSAWPRFEALCISDLVDQAASLPRCVPTSPGDPAGLASLLPGVHACRTLIESQSARCWLAGYRGEWEESMRGWHACMLIVLASESTPSVIGAVVAHSCFSTALRAGTNTLSFRPPEFVLSFMMREMEAKRLNAEPGRLVQGERLTLAHSMMGLFDDQGRVKIGTINHALLMSNGLANALLIDDDPEPDPAYQAWQSLLTDARINTAAPFFFGRDETVRALDGYFKAAERWLKQPRAERLSSQAELPGWARSLDARHLAAKAFLTSHAASMVKFASMSDSMTAHRHAFHIMLSIERFERSRGRYPESLAELVPEFEDETPMDAFNEQAFGYRLATDDEAHRTGFRYVLYSFGDDLKDDGGKVIDGPSRMYWSAHEARSGEDFVYSWIR